jgi:phosphatidylglycerophosphatase C
VIGETPETIDDRVVAAFDFDGTLTRRDTLLPFLVEVVGRARVARALASDAARLSAMTVGRADRDAAKAALVARLLTGMDHNDLTERGRVFAARVVDRDLRDATIARLHWHANEGHELVIVSASLDVYLHEVAQRLGVGAVLCTTLEVADGRVTGALQGGNCRGPEKAARLVRHLEPAGDGGVRTVKLWAYGDSGGDRELLAMADHPVRVTRRGRLIDASTNARNST